MPPTTPLPYSSDWSSPEEYLEELLNFSTSSDLFQILCGGVHILDFFTTDPGLFYAALPEEWHEYLLSDKRDIMDVLDLLLRDDLDEVEKDPSRCPPDSLLKYIRQIRKFALGRTFTPSAQKLPVLPRAIALGMKPKKVHEVVNFADYVGRLSDDIAQQHGTEISHFVDFGSGQNYLGRVLASEPYNRHVIGVEGREKNVSGAKYLDAKSGLAITTKVKRNKKLWTQILDVLGEERHDPKAKEEAIRKIAGDEAFDFRATQELDSVYTVEEGKGQVQYISGRLNSGDLGELLATIQRSKAEEHIKKDPRLMAVSIHSCGNLSHYAIRSMILNREIRAVAIVGCCYNLLTERLGPPTYKHIYLRPTLQAVNGRVWEESDKKDPQGFPMSERFCTYGDDGVRLNITARMMSCQAPFNWSREESQGFFSRHFYRAVLQRIFLDRGVVNKVRHDNSESAAKEPETPFNVSTNPLIIGSLRKGCYGSLKSYIRGALDKLTTSTEYKQYGEVLKEKMGDLTDEEIDKYEAMYMPRKKELCVIWSMMAFSAMVAESLIVTDRWMFLKEHSDIVRDAWVETVFDYGQSPRNLVVVGIKKEDV